MCQVSTEPLNRSLFIQWCVVLVCSVRCRSVVGLMKLILHLYWWMQITNILGLFHHIDEWIARRSAALRGFQNFVPPSVRTISPSIQRSFHEQHYMTTGGFTTPSRRYLSVSSAIDNNIPTLSENLRISVSYPLNLYKFWPKYDPRHWTPRVLCYSLYINNT